VSDQDQASGCPHRELAVGWALHALEPAEESLVIAHLGDCPECTRVAAETEQVGAALGLSIRQVSPSPELEQRVLAVVNVGVTAPVTSLPQLARQATPGWRSPSRLLAAAASVILIAVSVLLGIRVVQLDAERDQAARQIMAMTETMRRVADPAWAKAPLVTADGRPMGLVLAGTHRVELVATDLPGNKVADQIYVLWGLGHGAPAALTGFDVPTDGPVLHEVPSVPDAGEFTGYAVSLEPGRHLPTSPTTVMASGQVES
jgi:hypothetical protein